MHFSEKQRYFLFHGKQRLKMDEENEIERSLSDAIDDEPPPKAKKVCRKLVYLFNCDKTYSLDSVGKLLLDMKGDIRRELSFDIFKTYFRLSEMSNLAEKAIPQLQMDLAFFVVHANESRLSINEENAGIGYAKVYNALLQATDGKVIIVIGGDDHYRSKDEEESSVISRWASRKVSSQFENEFLDGRKSFIFSWNKTHRKIHEEALLHCFDPGKKGRKFEWKLIERPEPPQETPYKKPETENLEVKGREQSTDHPHVIDGAHNSSEKDVNKETSVSAMRCCDKGDKEEKREKDKELKDYKGNGDKSTDDCARKIASRKTTEPKDSRDVDPIAMDDFAIINNDDLIGYSEEQQMNGKTTQGTLVMKTVLRNGSISFKEDEYAKNPQWIPPDEFLLDISERLAHIAEVEVEIFRKEETGALCAKVIHLSVIYSIIEYFLILMNGLFDRVYNLHL